MPIPGRSPSIRKNWPLSLNSLIQEQAFKTYQSIRFAHEGDEIMVKKFEALLKEHPDFLLKDKVESELGYAYARMDERKKSALAFQAIASQGENKLSTSDQAAYETADRYWHMRTTWAFGRLGCDSDALGPRPRDEAVEAAYLALDQKVPDMACPMGAADRCKHAALLFHGDHGLPDRHPCRDGLHRCRA